MALSLMDIKGVPARADIKTFMCTTVDEISLLPRQGIPGTANEKGNPDINKPCGIGSKAIVKTGEVYLLWPDNEWAPF